MWSNSQIMQKTKIKKTKNGCWIGFCSKIFALGLNNSASNLNMRRTHNAQENKPKITSTRPWRCWTIARNWFLKERWQGQNYQLHSDSKKMT